MLARHGCGALLRDEAAKDPRKLFFSATKCHSRMKEYWSTTIYIYTKPIQRMFLSNETNICMSTHNLYISRDMMLKGQLTMCTRCMYANVQFIHAPRLRLTHNHCISETQPKYQRTTATEPMCRQNSQPKQKHNENTTGISPKHEQDRNMTDAPKLPRHHQNITERHHWNMTETPPKHI